jgi:hypothetical protein
MRVDEAGPSRSLIKNATKPIKIRARAHLSHRLRKHRQQAVQVAWPK